jgi:hypothetical protein
MKRQVLWVPLVLWLCAGCAARPVSEAQVLVSDIVRERPSNIVCKPRDVRYCEVDVDAQKHCLCVDNRALFGPR